MDWFLYEENKKEIAVISKSPEEYETKIRKVADVTGNWINNLFYRMLKYADCPKTPKYIQLLYRAGVVLNFNWFKSGKIKINLFKLYDEDWNENDG